jgi:4-hydroxybenzoate polyprenyltransferase
MIPFYIAIIVACVAFWKFAAKLLIAVALFLLVSGIVMVINDLHHLAH